MYPFTSNINTSDIKSNVEILTSDDDIHNDYTHQEVKNTGSLLTLVQIYYSLGFIVYSLHGPSYCLYITSMWCNINISLQNFDFPTSTWYHIYHDFVSRLVKVTV